MEDVRAGGSKDEGRDPSVPEAPRRPALRVAVVEGERASREALVAWLRGVPGMECVGAFGSPRRALRILPAREPEILLSGLDHAGLSDRTFIERCLELMPRVRVVVLTALEDPERIVTALEAGAAAYLTHNGHYRELHAALLQASQGTGALSQRAAHQLIAHFHQRGRRRRDACRLAPREHAVLELLARGLSGKEIAAELDVSPHTVNDHLKSIYAKLRVHSRTAAIARVLAEGVLPSPPIRPRTRNRRRVPLPGLRPGRAGGSGQG